MRKVMSSWYRRGAHGASPSRSRTLALVTPLALLLAAALTAAYEMAAAQISATTADASTALLEGHALDHGNVLLHGWSLSLDSFWGLEALAYALVIPFTGVHLYDLHVEPALVATALFGVGLVLATIDQHRRSAVVAAVLLVALVAFPSPDLAYFMLQGPWHITTALACFVAFVVVASAATYARAALAALILAVASISDATALMLGIVPVIVVGVVQLLRTRNLRIAAPTLAGGFGAIVLVAIVHEFGKHVGLYTLVNRNLVISTKQLRVNFNLIVPHLKALFGIGSVGIPSVSQHFGGYVLVRGVLVAVVGSVVLVCCYQAARLLIRLRKKSDALSRGRLIEALLLIFVFFDVAFFVVGSANGHVEFTKYLTPGALALSILTARVIGAASMRVPRAARRAGAVVGLIAAVACGAQYFSVATRSAPIQKSHQLAVFLASHDFGPGIASYPIASLVSVDSGLSRLLRPISATRTGQITTFGRQEDASWYSNTTFGYLVFDTSVPWHGVNLSSAEHTYGKVAHIYVVGPYRVVTWSHRITVQPSAVTGTSPLHVIFRL